MRKQDIAQSIIDRRKELEEQPPSLEEIVDKAVSYYFASKSKKKEKALTQEQWDDFFKTIFTKAGPDAPEENQEFLLNIPLMHHSWWAIKTISKSAHMAQLYAMFMTKIYRGTSMPFEIEKIILALNEEEIIWQLAKKDYVWSHRAQHIMLHLHPKTYEKIFAVEHDSKAIIFA